MLNVVLILVHLKIAVIHCTYFLRRTKKDSCSYLGSENIELLKIKNWKLKCFLGKRNSF